MKLRNKKTGEVKKMWKDNICLSFGDCNKVYYSLAELNEEWEDVSTEPLIEDDELRKAIRAWAICEQTDYVRYDEYWQAFRYVDSTICFKNLADWPFEGLEDGKTYTIAELCGEKEESANECNNSKEKK